MRRVVWTDPARSDLRAIGRFIAVVNPSAARRIEQRLDEAGAALAEYPERGPVYRGRVRQLLTVSPYRILYRVTDDVVFILRIRHVARRPA